MAYASPEATALVGIQWEHLRTSPFADAISGELSGDGGLGFPDLDCIKQARQILISSPALLAMAAGDFPTATFREQAAKKGLKRALYHDVEIWVTPGKETLSIARMSDQLVLLGRLRTLQDAIDRSLLEEANRHYSPLLARAARYAQDDLFVVAAAPAGSAGGTLRSDRRGGRRVRRGRIAPGRIEVGGRRSPPPRRKPPHSWRRR